MSNTREWNFCFLFFSFTKKKQNKEHLNKIKRKTSQWGWCSLTTYVERVSSCYDSVQTYHVISRGYSMNIKRTGVLAITFRGLKSGFSASSQRELLQYPLLCGEIWENWCVVLELMCRFRIATSYEWKTFQTTLSKQVSQGFLFEIADQRLHPFAWETPGTYIIRHWS